MTKKVKISTWDTAAHLKNQADIDDYLAVAFEDGDPQVITRALGDVARAQNTTKLAKKAGVDRVNLYRALSGSGDPKVSTLFNVITALGYKLTITKSANFA